MIRAGMTTEDINTLRPRGHAEARRLPGAAQLPRLPEERVHLGQRGRLPRHPGRAACSSPATSSTSTSPRIYNGFHGDTSATFYIGTPSPEAQARHRGRARARSSSASPRSATARASATSARRSRSSPRARAAGWSATSSATASAASSTRPPQVSHVGKRGTGDRLKAGMCFTIEPMINLGGFEVEVARRQVDGRHRRRLALGAVRAHPASSPRPAARCSPGAAASSPTARSSRARSLVASV